MSHPFMAAVADGLAERSLATLRYQFPYMGQGRKRPDAPNLAQATVRAAVADTVVQSSPEDPIWNSNFFMTLGLRQCHCAVTHPDH
jgi:predicted alpha/beta-hydrolase family hydrolase